MKRKFPDFVEEQRVPPLASSKRPIRWLMAPVKAPLLMAEQFRFENAFRRGRRNSTLTNGPLARGEASWMARANNSLPVPVSPRSRDGRVGRAAASTSLPRTARIAAPPPTIPAVAWCFALWATTAHPSSRASDNCFFGDDAFPRSAGRDRAQHHVHARSLADEISADHMVNRRATSSSRDGTQLAVPFAIDGQARPSPCRPTLIGTPTKDTVVRGGAMRAGRRIP